MGWNVFARYSAVGIYDRDFMLKRWVVIIGILAVSLLTSALYLARSAGFGPTRQTAAARENLSLRVNINTATEEELAGRRTGARQADHRKRPQQNGRRAPEDLRHRRQAARSHAPVCDDGWLHPRSNRRANLGAPIRTPDCGNGVQRLLTMAQRSCSRPEWPAAAFCEPFRFGRNSSS